MAAAADIVQELAPDVCDINMGCPANKVLKGCAGAALLVATVAYYMFKAGHRPGTLFYADGRGRESVRLSFSMVDESLIEEGVERLAALGHAHAEQPEGDERGEDVGRDVAQQDPRRARARSSRRGG